MTGGALGRRSRPPQPSKRAPASGARWPGKMVRPASAATRGALSARVPGTNGRSVGGPGATASSCARAISYERSGVASVAARPPDGPADTVTRTSRRAAGRARMTSMRAPLASTPSARPPDRKASSLGLTDVPRTDPCARSDDRRGTRLRSERSCAATARQSAVMRIRGDRGAARAIARQMAARAWAGGLPGGFVRAFAGLLV